MMIARHKFSCEQYHLMATAGVFAHLPENRLELIKGEIIQMSPIGRKHSVCVARLDRLFQRLLSAKTFVWVQNPIRLGENSEPQPDLALLHLDSDFYEKRLPVPEDILLVVEVADSTIDYDRNLKMPLYAEFGIKEAWLIDVNEKVITKYTEPCSKGYKNSQILDLNDLLMCLDVEIAVSDILGML